MKIFKIQIAFSVSILLLLFYSCTTDPIIPAMGVPVEIIPDPGPMTNPCDVGVVSFNHEILPLMTSSCAYSGCHDAITREDGVVLDSYINILKQVTPGDPNDSDLYESIVEPGNDIMPPPPASPLTAGQIALVKLWIEQGANETDCSPACDPLESSFAMNVFPIIKDYCFGCHNNARQDGSVNLHDYNQVIPYVTNGQLIGTMKHDQFFAKMPPSGSKLSDCRIQQIEKWIAEGALNN